MPNDPKKNSIKAMVAKNKLIYRSYVYVAKIRHKLFGFGLYANVNDTNYEKNCLLLYIIEPFRNKDDKFAHQNYLQSRELARQIGAFGYNVDVLQFNDTRTPLRKKYDLVFDLDPGINLRYMKNLTPGAKRVAYLTGSNPQFARDAERTRVDDVFRRRGVRLKLYRQYRPIDLDLLSTYDLMFLEGNPFILKTYKGKTPKKVTFKRNTGYTFLENHDHKERSPKSFLFLAGAGQVYKGLDLLLEVFAKNPDLELYVCSSFVGEKDFCDAYHKELFETKNIHPVGFIDITGKEFADIAKKCAYFIAPSSSEGQAGSVLTAMSAGVIPIVSRECGYDEEDVIHLADCSLDTIEKTVKEYSLKPYEWRAKEAERAMKVAREKYGDKNFIECIQTGMKLLLDIK